MGENAPMQVCSPKPSQEWSDQVGKAKRLIRSELSLDDWSKYGFGTRRAAEFDKLAEKRDEPAQWLPRCRSSELTREEFWQRFESRGLPCIIEGIPESEGWPAWSKWTWDNFVQKYPGARFKVGKDDDGTSVRVRVDHFAEYLVNQQDDSPVYLFDNQFGGSKNGGPREELLQDYRPPSYFPDDFMAVSGEDDRPPYRWIGVGPRRSGTVMHQDPLCTSAWNTLISGRKRWVLLHPSVARSVAKAKSQMTKDDDDEAVNYFLDLLPRIRAQGVEAFEFVQYPGDTIFLPGNWWHCVVNVDDTIAVTQNYCGRHNFASIWRSTRVERPCWSHKWLKAMDNRLPWLSKEARSLNEKDQFDMDRLLQVNAERRVKRRQRREERDLKRARRKAGESFDEASWRKKRTDDLSESDTDSTVSTTSHEDTSDSSSDSSEEAK